MNLFKYKVTRKNGHIFSKIFTINEIEEGDAQKWIMINVIHEDELQRLPFVCTDKNGENVFAGDKCHITYDISPDYADKAKYRKDTATIEYDDERCLWVWIIDDHWKTIIDFSEYETDIELFKDNEVKNELNSTTNPSPADTGA